MVSDSINHTMLSSYGSFIIARIAYSEAQSDTMWAGVNAFECEYADGHLGGCWWTTDEQVEMALAEAEANEAQALINLQTAAALFIQRSWRSRQSSL